MHRHSHPRRLIYTCRTRVIPRTFKGFWKVYCWRIESFLTIYDLSNSGEEKLKFTPFWGGPKPGCSDSVRAGIIESHNFFVLGPILVKFHIRTWLSKSFIMVYHFWKCSQERLHFTPVHTLRQLKHDEGLFPPLRRFVKVRTWYG